MPAPENSGDRAGQARDARHGDDAEAAGSSGGPSPIFDGTPEAPDTDRDALDDAARVLPEVAPVDRGPSNDTRRSGSRRPAGPSEPRRAENNASGAPDGDRPATAKAARASTSARKLEGPRLPAPTTTKTGEAPPPRASDSPEKRRRRLRRTLWRWTKRLALASVLATATGVIALALVIRRIEAGLPSVDQLRKDYRPPQVTRILAADGSVLSEIFTERRTLIHIADLPPHVKTAVLAAEDATFYMHHGLDYWGIARAMWVNLRHSGARQGASTITQQVVKNLLLDNEKSYMRKIREALLARRIEQELTKDEILELYLNHIYFGSGRYGIEEAARGYFGKHASELSIAEAALLAGLPKSPNAYSPRNDLEASVKRRVYVLGQMLEKGFIEQSQYDAAMVEPVKLSPIVEASEELAPEVVDYVRKTIARAVGEDAARRGGFVVETSIDPHLQLVARAALRDATSAYDKRWKVDGPFAAYPTDGKDPKTHRKLPPQEKPFAGAPTFGHGDTYVGVVTGTDDGKREVLVDVGTVHGVVKLEEKDRYDPSGAPPSAWAPVGTRLRVSLLSPAVKLTEAGAGADAKGADDAGATQVEVRVPLRLELGPEAAMVSIDVRTRHVIALIGNVEGAIGGLDRALQSKRQPGSTFKPFVYGAALSARKITPATLIDATPGTFGGWKPDNFETWAKDEPVRAREALAQSINLVAVRIANDLGPRAIIEFAQPLGITSPLKEDLTIALGSSEVSPMELATAYSSFAAGGMFAEPTIITRLVGPDGKEIALPDRRPTARAMGEAEAYVLTSMMTSVVDHGTGASAKVLGVPIAGKTGTSSKAKDTWFAGFTTDIATVVWVGYDDARPLGSSEFGAKTALPAWIAYMKEATKGKPKADFPRPQGVITVKIDPKTGLLPFAGQDDAMEEIFLVGTDPTEVAKVPADDPKAASKTDAPEDPWAAKASP